VCGADAPTHTTCPRGAEPSRVEQLRCSHTNRRQGSEHRPRPINTQTMGAQGGTYRCGAAPASERSAGRGAARRRRWLTHRGAVQWCQHHGEWHHSSQRAAVAQRRCAVVPTPRGGGTTARSEPWSHRGAVQWCRHRGGVAPQLAASRSRTEALCSGADTAGGWHHSLQRAVVAQRRRRVARGRENSLLLCG
jgi:hypothetical protein